MNATTIQTYSNTELVSSERVDDNDQHDQTINSQQEIQKNVEDKKKLYDHFYFYIDDMENTENNFQSLIDIIDNHLESGKEENFEHFLCLLTYITNNHHRNNSFI